MKHIFIVGAKGFVYGGYETFLDKLTEYHQQNDKIKYFIACKENGEAFTDETTLHNVKKISDKEFLYHNAHCFKIHVPEKIGPAQAIYYDCKSIEWCIDYIKLNHITDAIVYVLACRIGPFFGYYVKRIHALGGKVFVNPDGHEWKRSKWSGPIRKYWKESERLMVKHADLLICDSLNIEKYIKNEYQKYAPDTTYIAYGAEVAKSALGDHDVKYVQWLNQHGLKDHNYYISVGRFVPENNFEIMIREFMKSKTDKDFAIITTDNEALRKSLDEKLHFSCDQRIKFVGSVYDTQLLKKIRENAFAYFHGHSVGGTNPSLLEALGSTKLNLLFDIGFNYEVALDAALYWNAEEGNLAHLIDTVDKMSDKEIESYSEMAKERIKESFSWNYIADRYQAVFLNDNA